jgi:hypothetical protein
MFDRTNGMSKTMGMNERGNTTMGWPEFYARRDALNAALARAAEGLPFDEGTADRDDLLLGLQHRWSQRLAGRIELAVHEAETNDTDLVDAVGAAWRETAAANPVLRDLLDANAADPVLRPLVAAEQRMLASAAGLTESGDDLRERAAIGAAFLALQRKEPRRNPVERLLRMLVPSA